MLDLSMTGAMSAHIFSCSGDTHRQVIEITGFPRTDAEQFFGAGTWVSSKVPPTRAPRVEAGGRLCAKQFCPLHVPPAGWNAHKEARHVPLPDHIATFPPSARSSGKFLHVSEDISTLETSLLTFSWWSVPGNKTRSVCRALQQDT
jgi:hypothetical protein